MIVVESFEHCGFRCEVVRNESLEPYFPAFHCGYVTVPLGHPWHGQGYLQGPLASVSVHGGITYSEPARLIRSWPLSHLGTSWTVGFDTNHAWDGPAQRTQDYCREQTCKLAEQAFEAQQARSGVLERQDWFLTMNEGETR